MVAVCAPSVYVVGERRDLVVVRLIIVDRMYHEPFYTVTARGLADRVRKEDPEPPMAAVACGIIEQVHADAAW